MRRALACLLGLALLAPATADAVSLRPLELPPPELASYLSLVAPPLDKPPLPPAEVSLPDPPRALPPLPLLPLALDPSRKPVAPLASPRILACNPLGTVFRVASELLECGKARFQQDEFEKARNAFEAVVKRSTDRSLVRDARYWLGETLVRLGRYQSAERNFLLVVQESPVDDLHVYATYSLGWVALKVDDPARALTRLDELRYGAPALAVLVTHRRAMALYALGRFEDARGTWDGLRRRPLTRSVSREVALWLGDTLGRLGEPQAAVEHLQRFAAGGLHPLIETGILRLGWWSLAAGDALEAVKAYRWLLSAYPRTREWPWARFGLGRALLVLGDWPEARPQILQLRAAGLTHPVVLPGILLVARWAVEHRVYEAAHTLHQEVLGLDVGPEDRAYTLLLDGEVYRREGLTNQAQTQFELVKTAQPDSPFGRLALFHLGRMNLAMREFSLATTQGAALLSQTLPQDLRAAALLLNAEAAYWAGDWDTSAAGLGRFLVEFSGHPLAGAAAFSLGWVELRRGNNARARQQWATFARSSPDDPHAPEALLLAAELAQKEGDTPARELVDHLLVRYPDYGQADLARLNRAILDMRAGRSREATQTLVALVRRSPRSPFLGRVRLVLAMALLAQGRAEEARNEFSLALGHGEGALAHLGWGSAAVALGRWKEAAREFTQARDSGTAPISRAAAYGLVTVLFNEGRREEFRTGARSLLQAPPSPSVVPPLVYVLAALAVEDKRWDEARTLALRLLRDHPTSEPVDDALFRLGTGAATAGEWTLAGEAFRLLEDRYPKSPLAQEARLGFAEALLRTGALTEARARLETFVASASGDPRLPHALFLLARAREAAGERSLAIDAYSRFLGQYVGGEEALTALVAQGRLLAGQGRWGEARQVFERALAGSNQALAVEAAFRLGEGFRARGAHEDATDAYLTAAYLAPGSIWGQRALLGAGQSFTSLNQTDSAVIVYRKLLAKADVKPDLAQQAREALAVLGADVSDGSADGPGGKQ